MVGDGGKINGGATIRWYIKISLKTLISPHQILQTVETKFKCSTISIKRHKKGGLYPHVVMICSSMLKTVVMDEALVKDKDKNNKSGINSQN